MSLAPQEMSVPAGDGRILKGALNHPAGTRGATFPRDSFSPLGADLHQLGVATLAFVEPRAADVSDDP